MQTAYRPIRWTLLLMPIILLFTIGMSLHPLTITSAARSASGCAGLVAGQYIYDCTGVLTAAETAYLETQAAAVVRAGAPTVVYLQMRPATAGQTLQDAIDLMNRWNVESRPGAHDGFVMFFNVQPGNLRHGQVALYAGEKHFQHGNLPQSELDRIRVDVMTPLLSQGHTAEGIAAGLQMVAHDLRYGPPPPPAYQQVAAGLGRIPFTVIGLLFAAVVALLLLRLALQPPPSSARDEVGGMQVPASPGELPPGMAGALLVGRVNDAQVEGTMLDFARRGLLAMEPGGKNKVEVHLLGSGDTASTLAAGYEQETWESLARLAGGPQGTVSGKELTHLRQDWGDVKRELRRELVQRGWYDPEAAGMRRRPLYILGTLGMVGTAFAVLLIALSHEWWAAIGGALFLAAGLTAYIRGYAVPDTTVEGEIAAAPWRAYRASVTAREYEPNLDTDLPYIVALGVVAKLAPRLKAASERGYSPSWFHGQGGQERQGWNTAAVGFYPYWVAFHASAAPASASGGYAGGGAAAGGGGSAGGY
jgi:uncharacterized membrane protein YgcG